MPGGGAVKDVQYVRPHRAVHVHGHVGHQPFFPELPKQVHQRLGTLDGETGDNERPAILICLLDDLQQFLLDIPLRVEAVAVGAFYEQEVSLFGLFGWEK